MNVEIMSRAKMIDFSHHDHNERIAVVSISDVDKDSPVLQDNTDNGIYRLLNFTSQM